MMWDCRNIQVLIEEKEKRKWIFVNFSIISLHITH